MFDLHDHAFLSLAFRSILEFGVRGFELRRLSGCIVGFRGFELGLCRAELLGLD